MAIDGFSTVPRSLERGRLKFTTANGLWYRKKVRPVYPVSIVFASERNQNLYVKPELYVFHVQPGPYLKWSNIVNKLIEYLPPSKTLPIPKPYKHECS